MKKILAVSVLAALVSQPGAAVIDFYVGGTASVGNSISIRPEMSNLEESARSFGAVAGIDIPFLRLEAEYNYITAQDIHLHAAMGNLYFKLLPLPIITPYIAGGVGQVFSGTADGMSVGNSMAYQAMLGITVDVPIMSMAMDIEGRVFYADNIFTLPSPIDRGVGFLQYDVRAKLKYVF